MALSPLSVFFHHFSRVESQTHQFLDAEEEPYYHQEKEDAARSLNDQLQSLSIKCHLLKQQGTDIWSDELESISHRINFLQGRLQQRTPMMSDSPRFFSASLFTVASPAPIADMASALARPSAFTLLRPVPKTEIRVTKEEHKAPSFRSASAPAAPIRELIQITDAASACKDIKFRSLQAPRIFDFSKVQGLAKVLEQNKMKAEDNLDEPRTLKVKRTVFKDAGASAMEVDESWDATDHFFFVLLIP